MRWTSRRGAAAAAAILIVAVGAGLSALALGAEPPGTIGGPVARIARPAWLGVKMEKSPEGPIVRHLVRGSPASKAGLRDGDRIARVAGKAVAAPEEVTHDVAARAAGETIEIVVVRAGAETPLRATLDARPNEDEILRMDAVGAFAQGWKDVTPLAGAPAGVDALRGKVVLVDFWASWCGACRMSVPQLAQWQAKYGAQGLAVVGMTTDPPNLAATAAEQFGIKYPVVVDAHGETTLRYGVSSLPTLYVIDRRGVVRDVLVGVSPSQDLRVETLLRTLIAEAAPAQPTH